MSNRLTVGDEPSLAAGVQPHPLHGGHLTHTPQRFNVLGTPAFFATVVACIHFYAGHQEATADALAAFAAAALMPDRAALTSFDAGIDLPSMLAAEQWVRRRLEFAERAAAFDAAAWIDLFTADTAGVATALTGNPLGGLRRTEPSGRRIVSFSRAAYSPPIRNGFIGEGEDGDLSCRRS